MTLCVDTSITEASVACVELFHFASFYMVILGFGVTLYNRSEDNGSKLLLTHKDDIDKEEKKAKAKIELFKDFEGQESGGNSTKSHSRTKLDEALIAAGLRYNTADRILEVRKRFRHNHSITLIIALVLLIASGYRSFLSSPESIALFWRPATWVIVILIPWFLIEAFKSLWACMDLESYIEWRKVLLIGQFILVPMLVCLLYFFVCPDRFMLTDTCHQLPQFVISHFLYVLGVPLVMIFGSDLFLRHFYLPRSKRILKKELDKALAAN